MSHYEYLVKPVAPLVVRSGVPFGSGVKADGANFPLPSAVAGLVRTTLGLQQGLDFSDAQVRKRLLGVRSKGPFAYTTANGVRQLCFPKPNDCYFMDRADGSIQLIGLSPASLPEDSGCDLPEGLLPVRPLTIIKGKPNASVSKRLWSWTLLSDWLLAAQLDPSRLFAETVQPPSNVVRTHVAIDAATHSAIPGKLFQTAASSYEPYIAHSGKSESGGSVEGLALWADQHLHGDSVCLGGERRLSRLFSLSESDPVLPAVPQALLNALVGSSRFRLLFITPGLMQNGALPVALQATWQPLADQPRMQLKVQAVALSRMQAISGWDMASNAPKATRRAVPAGSVYWCESEEPLSVEQVKALWFSCLSYGEQDRADGFGVVLPGVWN